MVLELLVAVLAALLALGLAAVTKPRLAAPGALALCGIAAVTDIAYLLVGAPPLQLALPFGLPGTGIVLGIDGISGFFVLLVSLTGAAASAAALEPHAGDEATAPFFPPFLAALLLTLLAADGFSLVLGFEAMSLASFALVLTSHRIPAVRSAALLYLGIAAVSAACLIPAVALLGAGAPAGFDLGFAAMRAHPPEGWRAAAVLALVVIGAGGKAGLAPLHVWLPPAHAAAPSHVSAVMSGAMTKVALYVIVRVLFDLCGPAQPVWWGVPLIALGACSAALGALRANLEGDIKAVLACSTVENVGLIATGLGVALAARAADLSPLAAFAMGATLLHALAHGLFKSLLFLAAGAVQHAAGTRLLERLGGLIHRMPLTTACVLAGAAALSGLPPTSGFAGEWALFQTLFGAPRVGSLAMQTLVCMAAALMALAVALAASAAVRLVGVAFLGRPRTPRVAAAHEAGAPVRAVLIALAVATLLIGLFPGAVLHAAKPALRLATGVGLADRASLLAIAPQADGAGYAATAVAVLLGLALGLVAMVLRPWAASGHRRAPAWDCGFAPPPPWLPFGDPLTQYSGAGFSQPLRRALGTAVMGARESVDMPLPGETQAARLAVRLKDPATAHLFQPAIRLRGRLSELADRLQFLTIRRTLCVMFAALVLFLIAVALMEQLP